MFCVTAVKGLLQLIYSEIFYDDKRVARSRNSQKDRQYNDKRKRTKDQSMIIQRKLKDTNTTKWNG